MPIKCTKLKLQSVRINGHHQRLLYFTQCARYLLSPFWRQQIDIKNDYKDHLSVWSLANWTSSRNLFLFGWHNRSCSTGNLARLPYKQIAVIIWIKLFFIIHCWHICATSVHVSLFVWIKVFRLVQHFFSLNSTCKCICCHY